MVEGGAIGVTEVIDSQLTELRTRTKKHLTSNEAEVAFGDLVSTINVMNVFSAAELGFSGSPQVDTPVSALEGVIQLGSDKAAVPQVEQRRSGARGSGGDVATTQAVSAKPTGILAKLKDWVTRIKDILHDIAKAMGATSYTISVGFPWGMSIAVTFGI